MAHTRVVLSAKAVSLAVALAVAVAAPAPAQVGPLDAMPARRAIKRHHLSVDIGPLQGGLSYALRLGKGRFSLGGGPWAAWEPWNSFDQPVLQSIGGELFVRFHPSTETQVEIGPSLLRYLWADD